MSTGVIYQIGIHPTAETAEPTLPDLGDHFDLTTSAGFTAFGNAALATIDYGLDEESIGELFAEPEVTLVHAPLGHAPSAVLVRTRMAQEFTFQAYDIDEDVFALDSGLTIASNAAVHAATMTARTVIIEVSGFASIYLPKCRVRVKPTSMGAGQDGVARAEISVLPMVTSTVPGGWRISYLQAGE
jgi:hypothetical protein